MAHQATRTTFPEGPDAPRLDQPDLYAAAAPQAHLFHQHVDPCADATPDA